MSRIDKLKEVIKENYNDAKLGIFFTRNWVGDPMTTIYKDDEVTVDICYHHSYFEVFGLTDEEERALESFYNGINGGHYGAVL